jgi:hypothetical protein
MPDEYLKQLKFSECLPRPYAKEIVKDRLLQRGNLETILMAKKKICVRRAKSRCLRWLSVPQISSRDNNLHTGQGIHPRP